MHSQLMAEFVVASGICVLVVSDSVGISKALIMVDEMARLP